MNEKDIEQGSSEDTVEFDNPNVYRVLPLHFGGFIAIDPENIHCYRKRIKTKVISKKLRNPMKITAFCAIDEFDSATKKTKEGQNLMRYLFANENGELYMLAFYLDSLHLVTGIGSVNQFEANSFMIIEFLGEKLSNCSSLMYLDNGYIFYGSKLGDSYLIQLQSDNTGDKHKPYIVIQRTYQNLGMI